MSGEGLIHHVPMLAQRQRRSLISCPVCNAHCRIYSINDVTLTVKDLWVRCENITCGHTARHQVSLVYVLCPSQIPHDHLDLPQPPPGLIRHVYPAGPAGKEPDPNQIDLLDWLGSDPDVDRDEDPPPEAAQAA
jgi:hypothetical protein